MKRISRVYPKSAIRANTQSRSTARKQTKKVFASGFDYEVDGDDPGMWEIDYEGFFDTIRECLYDLGIDFEEEEGPYSNMYGLQEIFTLEDGRVLDSYELETDILGALADREINYTGQETYIKNYIKSL